MAVYRKPMSVATVVFAVLAVCVLLTRVDMSIHRASKTTLKASLRAHAEKVVKAEAQLVQDARKAFEVASRDGKVGAWREMRVMVEGAVKIGRNQLRNAASASPVGGPSRMAVERLVSVLEKRVTLVLETHSKALPFLVPTPGSSDAKTRAEALSGLHRLEEALERVDDEVQDALADL